MQIEFENFNIKRRIWNTPGLLEGIIEGIFIKNACFTCRGGGMNFFLIGLPSSSLSV